MIIEKIETTARVSHNGQKYILEILIPVDGRSFIARHEFSGISGKGTSVVNAIASCIDNLLMHQPNPPQQSTPVAGA